MTDPVIMNDDRLRSLLGELSKTRYDEGIRLTLERQAKKAESSSYAS
jgi:hypothetical protein